MTVDLEEQLRAEFANDALCAPISAPEWDEISLRPQVSREVVRPWSRIISIAAAVLLIVGAIAAISTHDGAAPTSAFVPSGEEFALTDEFPLREPTPASLPADWAAVARPGSARFASAPGLAGWLATFVTVDYDYTTGTLAQWTCLAMSAPQATFGMICPLDGSGAGSGGDGTGGRSQWVNVPSGTSIVEYVDGTGKSWWQRPIGRMAMFPDSGNDGTFTAYSDDGTPLQTFSPATELDASGTVEGAATVASTSTTAMEDSLTPAERDDLRRLVRDQMSACVEASGATYPNGSMFPDGDSSAWDDCVATVRTELDQRLDALGSHLIPSLPPTGTTDLTSSGTEQP